MVKVEMYETVTDRKSGNLFGVFHIPIIPETIPETSEKLKGKFTSTGKDMYELAEERRAKKVEKAVLECKAQAISKVREYILDTCVLVATIVE